MYLCWCSSLMWRTALAMIFCKTASQVSVSVFVSVEVIDGYKNITFPDLNRVCLYTEKKYHIWEEKRMFTKNIYIKKISHYWPQKCVSNFQFACNYRLPSQKWSLHCNALVAIHVTAISPNKVAFLPVDGVRNKRQALLWSPPYVWKTESKTAWKIDTLQIVYNWANSGKIPQWKVVIWK